MRTILTFGFLLGLFVEIWTAILIAAGWHKDPSLLYLFFLVVPIQATLLVFAIRQTAATGVGVSYARKVVTGVGVSVVGGILVALGSIVLTTVAFPHYFDDLRTAGVELLRKAGKSPQEVTDLMKANEPLYSPWPNALQGFVGTMITGLLVSMVASGWIRKR